MLDEPKDVVLEFLNAFPEGRIEDAIALMADDCECWYTGAGTVSRDDFANGMRALNAAVESVVCTIKEIIQEGNRIAVEYSNRAPLKNGKLYTNTYHSKFVVENGKITVIREYLDSLHVAQVLRGIAPNVPEDP